MIVAIIPARGGSKRISRKNLQKIGKLTLVEWSIHTAQVCRQVGCIDQIVVSSDDPSILQIARAQGVTDWKRCAMASDDNATDWNVIEDFFNGVADVPDSRSQDIDLIVYLRPTTPLRTSFDVEVAIRKMKDVPAATGLRSVHEMSETAYKCMEIIPGGILKRVFFGGRYGGGKNGVDAVNLPNHQYLKTYKPNGVVDIIRPEEIAQGNTFGDSVMAHITSPVIEIDTPHDLELARYEYAYKVGGRREVFTT